MDDVKKDVEAVLNKLRATLQADGGDIELVEVNEDGIVKVCLKGACAGCPMSQMTLAHFVEEHIRRAVPSIKRVEAV
ncbi:MAG: NifU family protein [Candidatus Omnitrophica bacterium]|nr:NifU family protein [Candidatus Omnitrophota bacterium]MBU4488295.1 NifU family protein [Candidatus Omnitrophota bacterium]MCG2704489.1 NifU family protein [Candidatus Omnitrophota bacterium]